MRVAIDIPRVGDFGVGTYTRSIVLERIRAERAARESAARISRANNHKPRKARQKAAPSVGPR